MKRRAFIQKVSLIVAAGLTCGFNRLFAEESAIARALGVPQPPQPPKPPSASVVARLDPSYAHEITSIPFDAPPRFMDSG